jgi:hypothetical protein
MPIEVNLTNDEKKYFEEKILGCLKFLSTFAAG